MKASAAFGLAVTVGVVAACGVVVGQAALSLPRGETLAHDIRPGDGVSARKWLSDYEPTLKGTPGETPVFVLDSGKPGDTVLVVAGTHGSELAGTVVATVLVERARAAAGRLVVIPHANNSAASYRDAAHPGPLVAVIPSASGPRTFRLGSRLTDPAHQGAPDPAVFRHPHASGDLDGVEARNLDRVYPGRGDGTLTDRMAHGVMEVLRREHVDLAFDLHESRPDSRLAWTIVAHPKSADLGATAVLALDADNVSMKLDQSADEMRGLSHREWGDLTTAQAFLFETPNPEQADKASGVDQLGDVALPLARRVGTQLAALAAVIEAYNGSVPASRRIALVGVPTLADALKKGVGGLLK
jgi:predicted deacylase